MPLVACLLASLTSQARATRFWRFKITRDGQPVFSGGIGMSDRTPPADVLRMGLHKAKVQLGRDSVMREEEIGDGDVRLVGGVVFRFPDLPPLELEQLRLIHAPQSRERTHVAGGYYDWMLHPDDADAIVRHYSASDSPAVERAPGFPFILATSLAAIAVALVIVCVAARRNSRAAGS
jgi:hypothetical protein